MCSDLLIAAQSMEAERGKLKAKIAQSSKPKVNE